MQNDALCAGQRVEMTVSDLHLTLLLTRAGTQPYFSNNDGGGGLTCANERERLSALDTGDVMWAAYSARVRLWLAFHGRVDERTVLDDDTSGWTTPER